jgi:hypothetical protein
MQQGVKIYQNKIPLEIHRVTFPMAALVTHITYAGVASHALIDHDLHNQMEKLPNWETNALKESTKSKIQQ